MVECSDKFMRAVRYLVDATGDIYDPSPDVSDAWEDLTQILREMGEAAEGVDKDD
jgi:hypothetical protein